jgi:hypothetical protein
VKQPVKLVLSKSPAQPIPPSKPSTLPPKKASTIKEGAAGKTGPSRPRRAKAKSTEYVHDSDNGDEENLFDDPAPAKTKGKRVSAHLANPFGIKRRKPN